MTEPEEAVEKTEDISDKKWYDDIQGIDTAAALKNSGSGEALKSVLQMFYESYTARSEEIQGYYDQKDWENYTIKVHALKSSARIIGAVEFGEAAQKLENAGKASDSEYIRSHNDAFMERYESFKELLSGLFTVIDQDPEKPED